MCFFNKNICDLQETTFKYCNSETSKHNMEMKRQTESSGPASQHPSQQICLERLFIHSIGGEKPFSDFQPIYSWPISNYLTACQQFIFKNLSHSHMQKVSQLIALQNPFGIILSSNDFFLFFHIDSDGTPLLAALLWEHFCFF